MAGCLWPCVTGGGAAADGAGSLFRSKARGPVEVVRHARELLAFLAENHDACGDKRDVKREHKTQKDVTQVTANLLRQKVDYRMVASDYLEENQDLLDVLMSGYDNMDIAIHYSAILRDCIRHQVAARYVLESQHMKKFFDYIQYPDFNIASDAFKTFKELLTRHRSSAAEFFSNNYDWFFPEFNSKLLSSSNYIIRRQATQLLGDILLDKSNTTAMVRYVSSKDNLIILMNLLREQSRAIQVEAFRVFKLFTCNPKKPPEIVGILVTNKSKILRFLADFTIEKEDQQFEADKAQVVTEISAM
ncbi:putative MO25-like protein At5g47540 isoform X2 [Oryza sativa Japonica Group]|uniref:putative MO25-like protein At5g47540 isoform X2 n=1 Tax=Oryza sativa subsp. japonica TaxID=39947 RepID=UPI000E1B6CB3|nr:putative MO25-like protein At5g47540 isoform X2 [Oryza sativa Japonica Group]KAF2937538.1 hypothetical protein DAI22_03g056900 [Oryza sativa Japonica Group]